MNAQELWSALRARGVNPLWYRILGVTSDEIISDSSLVLGQADDGTWTAWTWERGQMSFYQDFPDEDTACRWMYDWLMMSKKDADQARRH